MKPLVPICLFLSCAPVWAQAPLSVHVVDDAGVPVLGAQVQIRVWSAKTPFVAAKATDTKGTALFSIPSAPNGKSIQGNVLVGAKGFTFSQSVTTGGQAEIRLERGAAWHGQVVDENGKPLSGATVTLRGTKSGNGFRGVFFLFNEDENDPISALYSARSKADGTFVIENVPADKNLLFRAQSAGFALTQGQDGHVGVEQKIKLASGGRLHGRALDAAGKPIANIKVYAGNRSTMGGNRGKTDAQGNFTIDHLSPGLYILLAELPDNAPYILSRRTDVRVDAGKTAEVGMWKAQTGVLIRGMVRDATSKKPIEGASFAAANTKDKSRNDDSAWASSDATGHFNLRVLPGTYSVRSSGAPLGFMRSDATREAIAGAAGSPEIVFALQSSPTIRGVTLDEKGQPMKAQLSIGGFMGRETATDARGQWQYTAQSAEDVTFGGGSDESGYFEVVSPKRVDWPVKGPISITMRHKPWGTLAGRVLTPDGNPIEGVQIDGEFVVMMGDSVGYGAKSSAVSGKDGRFVLERLRDSRDLKVSGKKAGFEFQTGGTISRKGDTLSVSDLIFAPLAGKIDGTTQPEAMVVVAGRETRADAKGHFAFSALPGGKNTVYVAKDGNFGSATTESPLEINLQPIKPQAQDQELGRQMWADIEHDSKRKYTPGMEEWLSPSPFEDAMKAAQAEGSADHITEVAARWKKGDSLELLQSGLEGVTQPDRRADSWLKAALAANDPDLTKRTLEIAEAIFKGPTTTILWREPQLYSAAVLCERQNGEDDGKLALGRAIAYTLQNHPEKSRVEGAMQTQVGRNEGFCAAASIVAQGSPDLLREVLDSIDENSGFKVRAFCEAIPVVVKARGLDAALPLLTELQTAPAPTIDMEPHYQSLDPGWAFGQAVHDLIPLIGDKAPAQALELAQKVEGDEQRARALASAAKYQTPEVAAPLYREAVAKIGTEDAPRIAAMVWERDPKLGMELFAVARQKADDEMKSEMHGRNSWVPYAFYLARADAATARLILEREWSKSVQAKVDGDELASIATAMAPADAQRAMEMALLIPGSNYDWGMGARRRIAHFVFADQANQRKFVLKRIGSREAWDAGMVQW